MGLDPPPIGSVPGAEGRGGQEAPASGEGVRPWGLVAASPTPPPRLHAREAAAGRGHSPAPPPPRAPSSILWKLGPASLSASGTWAGSASRADQSPVASHTRGQWEPPVGTLRRDPSAEPRPPPPPCAQWSDLTWSKWRRAEPLRSCAGGRTGDRAGAGGKSQMTGFGGLCAGSRKAGCLGGQRRG